MTSLSFISGNRFMLGALLVLFLLLAGCQGFGKQDQQQPTGAFVGGTQGLEAAFAEDSAYS